MHHLNLKPKLLFLTIAPIIFILILSTGKILHDLGHQKDLRNTKEKIVEAKALSSVVHFMQKERGYAVGFLSSKTGQKNPLYIKTMQELDSAIKNSKQFSPIDKNFIQKLTETREAIEKFNLSSTLAIESYSKQISFLFDYVDVLTISAEEKKHKDILQAYGYLIYAKEQLGHIRATLYDAFISKSLSEDSLYTIKESLHIYNQATQKFKNCLCENPEILAEYNSSIAQKPFKEMLATIETTISNGAGNVSEDFVKWFDTATNNIDILKEVEAMLFKELQNCIDTKLKNSNHNIIIMTASLTLFLIILAYLMLTIIKKILSSARFFNEGFENSLVLLEQYKATVDSSFIVSKTDPRGFITYVNNAFCNISGYKEEELLGETHSIIRHSDTPKELFKEMWHTIKELKQPWSGEVKNLAKDGSAYWMETYINPILDKEGNVIEYIAMRADISEMQEEKERIRDTLGISIADFAEARHLANEYENAMSATWSIIRTDPNSKITYINETFSKISGYSLEDLKGRDCSELRAQKHIDGGDCEKLKSALGQKEIVKMQFENIAKDGSSYFMDATVIPIADSKGVIIEHLHLMCNITELVELHVEIENTQQDIICRMGEISESRSKETGNHIRRVAEYSRLLALKAGFEEKEANLISNASPMHDLGKVAIPDNILLKHGKLDADEWEIMQSHSTIGYTILSGSQRPLLNAAAVIAKEHHEKYDGSGYPDGVVGEDIHIYARIVAVADVFDALGSDRVYKKAWELEKILKLFEEEKGKHFDARLATLFLENIEEFLKIRDKYSDTIK